MPRELKLPKIVAVMSAPRVGPLDSMQCVASHLAAIGIPFKMANGAFWGQCLERAMSDLAAAGYEWIITLDFDVVFDRSALIELLWLMQEFPDADAIAPLMSKRGSDTPLMRLLDADGKPRSELVADDLSGQLLKVDAAHFGLTVFRVSKLDRLQHPWFHGQPNAAGEWREGRLDDDIYFWEKWKAAGNNLYVAHHVPVGHIEFMAMWPGEDFRPIWQHPSDFWKSGRPQAVRT